MARQQRRALASLALGACLLNLAGPMSSFVSPGATTAAAARGAAWRTRRSAVRDAGGGMPGGPVVAYSDALAEAAAKTGESVTVTKDVMKVKRLLQDVGFQGKLQFVVNDPALSTLSQAQGMVELMQPFESSVMPKFVSFLAKKKRLQALSPIVEEYMNTMYETQSIVPVLVTSAQALTEEQQEAIKAKLTAKTGASDIKLVCKVDSNLIAGLKIEYGFTDPELLGTATEGSDASFRTYAENAALDQGVVTTM